MEWSDATCYLNGRWLPLAQATVPVLDRGFIFGDGVYEVIPVDEIAPGRSAPFRAPQHFARLARSLAAVRIADPLNEAGWLDLLDELVARHPWPRQSVYIQVTRGVARRDHAFPMGITPTIFAVSSPWPAIPAEQLRDGTVAVTHADERWLHCDIKSVSLLGNVLMKQYAVEHGATETILLRDGLLTEGSSANVMVVRGGQILAPAKSHLILPGITVDAAFDVARTLGLPLRVGPVTEAELRSADEIWISSSGREVVPVTLLDGEPVGTGKPGALFPRLHAAFQQAKRDDAERWFARRGLARSAAA